MTEIAPNHPKERKIGDIELLRGIAILFVLIEHLRFNLFTWNVPAYDHILAYFRFWTGVDLFFAISGFVIARSLIPKLAAAADTTAFANATLVFWIRRVWRLLPSAWLWLMLILVATLAFNTSGAFGLFHTNFVGAVAGMLDVANFRVVLNYGNSDLGATFPYWSLSLEEQFYLLLPFIVFLSGRRLPLVLAIIVAGEFFLPRLTSLTLNQTRSDALALGVLIALWGGHASYKLFEPVGLKRSRLARAATLSLLLIGFLAVSRSESKIVPFTVGLIALLGAVLVWIASYDQDYLMAKGPLKSLMLWMGSRSYALYLVHLPAYYSTREIWYRIEPPGTEFGMPFTLRFLATAAFLMILFAELNYRFVETPLRLRGARIADRLAKRVPQLHIQGEPDGVRPRVSTGSA